TVPQDLHENGDGRVGTRCGGRGSKNRHQQGWLGRRVKTTQHGPCPTKGSDGQSSDRARAARNGRQDEQHDREEDFGDSGGSVRLKGQLGRQDTGHETPRSEARTDGVG
ncbi:hypothetical protein A4X09_0g7810, partial [Tilletia walkeri]